MPTVTPFPTAITTPLPGVDFYHDLQLNAPLAAGAVWAVLVLLMFVILTRPKQRTLQVVSLIVVVTLPLSILNAGVWAITVYVFVLIYTVINSLFRLVE